MSTPVMLWHLALDALSRQDPGRIPEPDLVMEDAAQVEAYMRAGREDGFFAHIYFFHALQAAPVICPGDRVVDLACGPANQLVLMARMHPEARFIGVDASETMLAQAAATVQRCHLHNVELLHGDMTKLQHFEDGSADVVVSTMSLHHLPDVVSLQATCREIRRVLKPGGGLYLVDFGRLKRAGTRNFFSRDRAEMQPALFSQDFRHSMQAAFSFAELAEACAVLGPDIEIHRTLIAPFMVAIRSAPRHPLDAAQQAGVRRLFACLTRVQRRDFGDFARLFTYAGFPLACRL